MNRFALATGLALASLAAPQVPSAFAEEAVTVQGKKKGGSVIIGPDGSVQVIGDDGSAVDVGADGTVNVKGSDGSRVKVDPTTTTVAPAGGAVNLVDNNVAGTRDCGGGTASIAGNRNKITFTNCSNVYVRGNYNQVTLGAGAENVELLGNYNKAFAGTLSKGSLMGNYNSLEYTGGAAKIWNPGKHNSVTKK